MNHPRRCASLLIFLAGAGLPIFWLRYAAIAPGAAAAQAAQAPAALETAARAALSDAEGTKKLAGLKQQVTVLRDTWGVPHIYAQNQHDLFFAQGFVTAQDRLFQMELWKRAGRGTLAEILGPKFLQRD